MAFASIWYDLREESRDLPEDAVLVTPDTERPFRVVEDYEDRIVVEFRERERERALWRDQFEMLHDRLTGGETLRVDELPPGVEPYVAVMSLSDAFVLDGRTFRAGDGTLGESPFLHAEWEVRRQPERVHDDALLLADLLARTDLTDASAVDTERLVDLYVLLSDVERGADDVRVDVGDELLDRVGPAGELTAPFGTVTRTTRERRHLRDEEVVYDALDEADIPRDWVRGVDRDKLDVVLAVTDLEESAVYDVEEQVYMQKTGVEEAEKHGRLEGLRERLAALEEPEAEELRAEITDIEERLDELLAAD